MNRMKCAAACSVLMVMLSGKAGGADETLKSIQLPDDNPMATLKPGPGVETTRAHCAICHSTDYIVRQPGSDAKQWDAEVKKMVTVFGAPISDEDVKVIADYLTSAYRPQATTKKIPPKKLPAKPGKSKGSTH
ncbi:MAG TPA: cytochrome c [Terriglobia bacterium]|nr:cytochrome c [Terriglobia bacterium]